MNKKNAATAYKAIKSVDGRLYKEHHWLIVQMYNVDKLTRGEIAAMFETGYTNVSNLLWRCNTGTYSDRQKGAQIEQFGKALMLLDEHRDWDCAEVSLKCGLRVDTVERIAKRNGLWR